MIFSGYKAKNKPHKHVIWSHPCYMDAEMQCMAPETYFGGFHTKKWWCCLTILCLEFLAGI